MENASDKMIYNSSGSSSKLVKPKASIFTFFKISSFLAFLTAYSHFFGYSFLRGKLEAMGFHAANVNPSVNESLFQASQGVAHFAYHILIDYLDWAYLLKISIPTALVCFLTAFFLLNGSNLKFSVKNRLINQSDNSLSYLAKVLVVIVSAVFGLLWQAIVAGALFVLLALLWSGMSLGNRYGKENIRMWIEEGVCKIEDWNATEASYVNKCIAIDEDGKKVFGKLIYQDSEQVYFLSNDAGYLLGSNGSIVYKSEIKHRPVVGNAP